MRKLGEEQKKVSPAVEKYFRNVLGEDYDKNDINAYYDSSLSDSENIKEIKEELNIPEEKDIPQIKAENEQREKEQVKILKEEFGEQKTEDDMFKEQVNVLIVGRKNSAKTSLGWAFTEKCVRIGKRNAFVYQYPKPELLKKLSFDVLNVRNMKQLYNLPEHSVVLIDEAHIHFNIWEKSVNRKLRDLLSLSRQKDINFILICHNSFFLNKSLFTFIDIRIIKEVNDGFWELERDFMRKLYQDVSVFGKETFFIDSEYDRGYKKFEKPEWFDELMSNAYGKIKKENYFK